MSSDETEMRPSHERTREQAPSVRRDGGGFRLRRTVSRYSRLVTVGVVLLVVTSTLAGAAFGGGLTIPAPEPGVERPYDDTFRVLASNDPDPARGSSTVQLYEYDNGTIREVNRTVVTQPVQLWEGSIRPHDALVIANESDMYQSGLTGYYTIPYRDQWYTLEEWNTKWGDRELRILPLYDADPSQATDTDGEYTVEVRNPNGWWNPVYGAEVEVNGSVLEVTNPGTAMVHTAEYQTITDRKRDIVEGLLRYSELAPSESVARSTAAVPMDNGSEVFPTVDGASTSLVWRSGSHDMVRDAYLGFIDVTPGVWYRSRYVTQTRQVNTYIPWDYRISVPTDYSESDSCTINGKSYSLTRWANYRLLDSEATVVDVTAGNISMQQWGPGQWTTLNYTSPLSEPRPLPVGTHPMTATLQIDVELQKRYGVSSSRCGDWDWTRVETRSVTLTRSVPIETINSDDLSVDVHVYDRPGDDVVSVEWTGEQGLAAGAAGWEHVEVQVGEKTMYVTAPWRFFSVSRNTAVEERTESGTSEVAASHSYGGQYPAMLRYRMSPANVSVLADQPADRHIWWETTRVDEAGSVEATLLPDTIVAPENANRTPLYDQYAGTMKSTDAVTGESISVSAVDIWGFPVTTRKQVTRYEESVLNVTIDDGTGTAEITLHEADGTPISGREVYVDGATVPAVVTNASGVATVDINRPIVQARFTGDDWWEPHSTYYLRTQAVDVSSASIVVDAIEVVGYLNDAVSNVVLFVEWLVLGIFAVFWMRYMRRRPA
ncbi:Ig-like domain-containing protein [Haloplanus rubicundus]|uniref:Ig-like domain-containing protein n=1 Tax=Haloplanus rubicundus TaxID=1547898 RepID=UPI0016518F1B|nr:Ig-like domain-containing protein [Haloplanus rubicundus]